MSIKGYRFIFFPGFVINSDYVLVTNTLKGCLSPVLHCTFLVITVFIQNSDGKFISNQLGLTMRALHIVLKEIWNKLTVTFCSDLDNFILNETPMPLDTVAARSIKFH